MSPKPARTIVPDADKTREQLLFELQDLKAQIAILREAEVENKIIAEALQESEACLKVAKAVESERRRLFDVLEALPVMVCLLTPDYHVVFANRSYRERFGEARGRHCYEYCFGRAEPCEFCEVQNVLKTGQPHHWEVKGPDDSLIDVYNSPLTDVDGSPMILKMSVDVTERKRAEEAITRSEQMLQLVMDNIPQGIFWKDRNSTYLGCNKIIANATGLGTPRDIIGKTDYDLPWTKEQADYFRAYDRKVMENDTPEYHIVEQQQEASGRTAWVETNKIPLHDAGGNVTGILGTYEDVTDRKRVEEKLRKNEETLRSIIDSSPVPMVLYNEDENSYFFNKKFAETFGYTLEDVPGIDEWWPLAYPDEKYRDFVKKRWYAAVNEAIKKRASIVPQEVEVTGKDGSKRHILAEFSSIGSINLAVLYDITERKRAEEALRDSQVHLDSIIRAAPTGIGVAVDRVLTEVNDRLCEMTGYTREELLGKNARILYTSDEDYEYVGREKYARIARWGTGTVETRWRCKDGCVIDILLSSTPLEPGDIHTGVTFTALDITERRRMEEALRLDEARLEALVQMNEMKASTPADIIRSGLDKGVELTGSSMGFFNIITLDEKSVEVNLDTRNLMGRSGGWPRSLSIEDGGLWTSVFKTRKPLVVNDYSQSHPYKTGLPKGHEPLTRVMGVPVFEGDHIVALFMVANKTSDYTDADMRQLSLLGNGIWKTYARMIAEEELKIAKDRAELYVDLMGHDINNMHQVALGYLELAEADMPHGDSRREYLVKPREVLQRSAQLISNVRKMQKLLDGSLHDQVIDLCEVLSDVQRELGSVPNKPIMLDLNGRDQYYVQANELLHDVFSNLVTNAIKHTGARTDITITLDDVNENGRLYYQVSVADNGPGVPDSFKDTIFNRALKGTNKAKGMGLGLYLVKSLVDSYKGRVWVEDRVKGDHAKGARFVVMLPAIEK